MLYQHINIIIENSFFQQFYRLLLILNICYILCCVCGCSVLFTFIFQICHKDQHANVPNQCETLLTFGKYGVNFCLFIPPLPSGHIRPSPCTSSITLFSHPDRSIVLWLIFKTVQALYSLWFRINRISFHWCVIYRYFYDTQCWWYFLWVLCSLSWVIAKVERNSKCFVFYNWFFWQITYININLFLNDFFLPKCCSCSLSYT